MHFSYFQEYAVDLKGYSWAWGFSKEVPALFWTMYLSFQYICAKRNKNQKFPQKIILYILLTKITQNVIMS